MQDLAVRRNQNVMRIGRHAKSLGDVRLLVGVDLRCDHDRAELLQNFRRVEHASFHLLAGAAP
jgi:hypothetical protein